MKINLNNFRVETLNLKGHLEDVQLCFPNMYNILEPHEGSTIIQNNYLELRYTLSS